MELILEESEISHHYTQTIIPETPPWISKKSKVILKISELPKTKTHDSCNQLISTPTDADIIWP